MVGGQEIDQHFLLLSGLVMLHGIHKFIETAPAPALDIIFQAPVYNHFFLA